MPRGSAISKRALISILPQHPECRDAARSIMSVIPVKATPYESHCSQSFKGLAECCSIERQFCWVLPRFSFCAPDNAPCANACPASEFPLRDLHLSTSACAPAQFQALLSRAEGRQKISIEGDSP